MQNNQTNVRGYSPQQNTGRMNTIPYPAQETYTETNQLKALWQQLDPAAVALMAAALLGLAYALYATISFWWLTKIIIHLVLAWVTVGINAYALFSGKREMMLIAAVGYIVSMLLFMNYFYLLILQAALCLWAWYKNKE